VSNTVFDGGDAGHVYGDFTFLVNHAQPSHLLGGGGAAPSVARMVLYC
jgi:hypothetical protein